MQMRSGCPLPPASPTTARRGRPAPSTWRICQRLRLPHRQCSRPATRNCLRCRRASTACVRQTPATPQMETPVGLRSEMATTDAPPGDARPILACPVLRPTHRPHQLRPARRPPNRGHACRPRHRSRPRSARRAPSRLRSAARHGGYGRGWQAQVPRRRRPGAFRFGCATHAPATGARHPRGFAPAQRQSRHRTTQTRGSACGLS